MAEDTKSKVGRIHARYRRAVEQRQKFNEKWAKLDLFYRGDQFNTESIPPWIPRPVTNFIHMVVTMKRAALASENLTGMLSAVSEEDVQAVDMMQQIYEWVWKKSKAGKVVRENIETSRLLGTGIAHVYWDEKTGVLGGKGMRYEGEIKVCEIEPSTFFPDPYATCLEDCQFVSVMEMKSRSWVENEFGVKLPEHLNSQSIDSDTDFYDRPYYSGGAEKGDEMVKFHSHYERFWNKDKDEETGEEIGGWNYKCTYLVEDVIVKEIPRLYPNMYPFAVLYDFKQRKQFWGKSTAELILDNQILVNKTESIIAMIGTLLQNPQKIVRRDAGVDRNEVAKYSSSPGHSWFVNGDVNTAIRWQEVPQIPQALFNLTESAKANIREITGMNEAYMGQNVGSLQTSSGVDSLIDRSTLRDKDQMFDLGLYIEQLSRLILGNVVQYYTDMRYIKVIKDSTRPNDVQFVPFIGADYRELEFDIHIDVSAKAPITLLRKMSEAKDRLQLQGQFGFDPRLITPQEYIENTDMVGKREIINRMNEEEQFSQMQKLQTVLQMSIEALTQGVDAETVMQMSEQHLQQLQSGQSPVDPFNPGGIPPGGVGEDSGIGSAADMGGMGDIQAQQQGLPAPPQGPLPPV